MLILLTGIVNKFFIEEKRKQMANKKKNWYGFWTLNSIFEYCFKTRSLSTITGISSHFATIILINKMANKHALLIFSSSESR